MAQLTVDWCPLGRDIFYRKFELYSMEWTADLKDFDDYIIVPASHGGPIAVTPNDKKIKKSPNVMTKTGKALISIYSPAGKRLSTIKWSGGKVLNMGWSSAEDLLVVQDDGVVYVYDIFGQFKRNFGMGQEARDSKVLDSRFFRSYNGTGVAVMTTSFRVFTLDNIENPSVRMIKDIGLESLPVCWEVVSEERLTQMYVIQDNNLIISGAFQDPCKMTPRFTALPSSIIEMAFSFNHKHLALLTDSGILWIGSVDVDKVYYEFNIKSPAKPKQIVWCGSAAVIVNSENLLTVVGLNGSHIEYYLDSSAYVFPEIDSVRLIGKHTHELLHKVPSVVTNIFTIGSMAPGAILLEASKEFQKKSYRADDYLRSIKETLEDAVNQCIQAAGHEYFPSTQKMLLRAAAFGKCFLPDLDPEPFVNMCKVLRVLNAVRDYSLSLPLTYYQFENLTMNVLIDRLVLRHHYFLAIKICQYLRIPDLEGASKILSHWAKYKVSRSHVDEDKVAEEIASKVGLISGISFSDIASDASKIGKTKLATKLLDYEPRASEQVPLLLKLKEYCPAVSKAIESGDTDLIFDVILQLRDILSDGEFLKIICKFPIANILYHKYCRAQDLSRLMDLYVQEDNFKDQGNILVIQSYQRKAVEQQIEDLHVALNNYRKSRNDFLITNTDEQILLLKHQRKLEEKFRRPYIGKSLHQTIALLLLDHQIKLADELRKMFKVSDKRYCWTKIQSFAEVGNWAELEKIGKKSPIGYEPLVDICLKFRNVSEARKYLPKVHNANKVKYYVNAGLLEEAADIALEQKDESGLNYIQSKCGPSNKNLVTKIQSMKVRLHSKH